MREPQVFEPVAKHLHQLACEAFYRCRGTDDTEEQHDAIAAVVLSTAALEGFINELGAYGSWHTEQLQPVGDLLLDAERKRTSIKRKYLKAANALDRPFNRERQPYKDFNILVDLRNLLAHPKQLTKVGKDWSFQTPETVCQALQRSGANDNPLQPWYAQICSRPIAKWACNTTSEMVKAILERLPPGGSKDVFVMIFCQHRGEDIFRPVTD
jgi:hypothetical protein